ncbi:hypothetical protein [Nocardiopsis changdeensis]|uniref:hypothetical protein n=1 Tax=Nocardiopsis changdeensis TaxID=2831969 RepID=UPI003F46ABD6
MTHDTDTDLDVEIPEAEPLPADDAPATTADQDVPAPAPGPETTGTEAGEGPPPLPPLLETGASTLATAGSGIYAATGMAGLVAAAGIATVAGVAYGVTRARSGARSRTEAGGRGASRGRAGTLFGSRASGRMASRSGRVPSVAGRGAQTRTAGARSGAGFGRHRGATGRTAGAGVFGRGGTTRGGLAGISGGRRAGSSAGGGQFGTGRSTPVGRRAGRSGGGLFGPSASGSTRSFARRAGAASGRSSGIGGRGGLFGGNRSRPRGRGRMTAISDPAMPVRSSPRRAHRVRRALRRGWEHPRTHRARVRLRKGWHKGRVRFRRGRIRVRDHGKRFGAYLRKRKWALKVRGWRRGFGDWLGRLWDGLVGRARDPRYGPMRGWQLGIAAAAIGALGAGPKKSQPRPPLVGRIIGTAAPVPGDGPLITAGRTILALTIGDTQEAPLAPEVQRVRDAAQEMQDALAALGGSAVGMLAYEQGLKELGPTLAAIADGVKTMATVAEDEQPLDGSVLEFFGTIEDAARGAAEVAEELPGLFRAAHEIELERLENPRVNEQRWDVSQQDD